MKDTCLRLCPSYSKSGMPLSFQRWTGNLPHKALPGSTGDGAPGLENSPAGPRSSGQPSAGMASSSLGGLVGAALAGTHLGARGSFLLKQIDDLLGRIGWYFTKPKGEKFSPASEELESGTAKSCLWLFSLPSQLLFLFLFSSSSQFSLLEGAHSCPGSYFPPPNVNLHPAANLWWKGRV